MGPIGDIPCLIPLVKSICCVPSKGLETAASFPLENLLKSFFIKKFFYCLKKFKSQSRGFKGKPLTDAQGLVSVQRTRP